MERTFSRLVTTFDEVPPSSCAHDHAYGLHRTHGHRQHDIGVDLKRRPPKSRPAAFPFRRSASFEANLSGTSSRSRKRPARTPPSTFLFLPIHLSNSPEPWQFHLPASRKSGRNPNGRNPVPPTTIGSLVTIISEELRRRAIAPSSGRRAVPSIYSRSRSLVSTLEASPKQ